MLGVGRNLKEFNYVLRISKMWLLIYMILLFLQLPTSSSHARDDMEEKDDMEHKDLEDLDGEGLNEPDMDEEDLDGED